MMTYCDLVVITEVPEPSGEVVLSGPAATRMFEHVPAGALHDLPWCLAQTADTCQGAPSATLVIPSTTQLAPQIDGGWRVTGVELDSGWYTVTRPGTRAIHLCVLDRIDPAKTPLFRPGWPAARIAPRVRRYVDLVGVPWYATAGVTGCTLMRHLPHRQPPTWWGDDIPEGIPGSLDMDWSPAGRGPKQGHRWDVRAQYLAAAQSAVLGSDLPASEGPIPWDPRRAGWWLVPEVDLTWWPPELDEVVPALWAGDPVDHYETGQLDTDTPGARWVTTPVLGWVILQRGEQAPPRILDTFVSQYSGRYLRRWAETLRDARYTAVGEQDQVEVLDAVKRTYTEGIGMLGRRGGRVYRPDWRATVVDLAKVLLLDKLVTARQLTGIWPSRIHRDSVWYDIDTSQDALQNGSTDAAATTLRELMNAWPQDDAFIGRLRYEGYEGPEPERCPHGYHVTEGNCPTCDLDKDGRCGPHCQHDHGKIIPDGFTTSLGLGTLGEGTE